MSVAHKEYDYIIAGGGMAGLSLAFYLNSSLLKDKKILIIDRDAKRVNDHTYCFWEKGESAFEKIVFHRWKTLQFFGNKQFNEILDFGNYEYKMIRAADFYQFILDQIAGNPHIEFVQTTIKSIENDTIQSADGTFRARQYIFDSFTRQSYDNPKHQNLWQHFLGWTIETEADFFDPQTATLFDFRVEQNDECRFVYTMPTNSRRALVEFTIFSDNILPPDEYEFHLRKYLADVLKIKQYKITETENGVIPMSDAPHDEFPAEKTIRIGTSGGYVKPSTGYSFYNTQKKLQKLVEVLERNQKPQKTNNLARSHWKKYLDSVLLNVLRTKKVAAHEVFKHLFQNNPTERVLKFLDEETNLAEDLQVMKTVPLKPFVRAAIETGKLAVSGEW